MKNGKLEFEIESLNQSPIRRIFPINASIAFTLLFFASGILLAITLGIRVHRQMKLRVQKAQEDLESQGFVMDHAYMRPIGKITRIWARFDQPVGLYVQASDMDPVSIAAGHLGVADIKIGHMEFDSRFVIRSNAPELVSQVFDAAIRSKLLKFSEIRFRTGSIYNLLGADYFPELKEKRALRSLWMIEKSGLLDKSECEQLFNLGKDLATKAELFGRIPGKSLESAFFEGR